MISFIIPQKAFISQEKSISMTSFFREFIADFINIELYVPAIDLRCDISAIAHQVEHVFVKRLKHLFDGLNDSAMRVAE
jgi:hypothetical protein